MTFCTCQLNRAKQKDPTQTSAIRRRFIADLNRRFSALWRLIWESLVTNDALGLRIGSKPQQISVFAAAAPNAFAFGTDAEKVDDFMDWLSEQSDAGILEVSRRQGRRIAGATHWSDIYIESAYKKGVERGYAEMVKAGGMSSQQAEGAITGAFFRPIHADRVGLLYTRTFSELRGVTDDMDQRMSRVLAQGIADGKNPRAIARELRPVLNNDLNRAKTIARTEVIRAHHAANVNTYKEAGAIGVTVVAEWSTAGDDRVCPDCEDLHGRFFTMEEIEGLIPLHPNCRCVAIPVVDPKATGQKFDREQADELAEDEGTKPAYKGKKRGFYEKATGKKRPPNRKASTAIKREKPAK